MNKIYSIILFISLIILNCSAQSISITPQTQGNGVRIIASFFHDDVDDDPVIVSNSWNSIIFITNIFDNAVNRKSIEIDLSEITQPMNQIIQFQDTQYILVFFETIIVKIDMVSIFGPNSGYQDITYTNSELDMIQLTQPNYKIKQISQLSDFDEIGMFIDALTGEPDLVVFLDGSTMEFSDNILSAQAGGSVVQEYWTCIHMFRYFLEGETYNLIAIGQGLAQVSVKRISDGGIVYNTNNLQLNNDVSQIDSLLYVDTLGKMVAGTQNGSLVIFDLQAIDGNAPVEYIDQPQVSLAFQYMQPVIGTSFIMINGQNLQEVRVYDTRSKEQITSASAGITIGKAVSFIKGTGYYAHQKRDDTDWLAPRQILISQICTGEGEYLNFKYQECTNLDCPSNLIYHGICQECDTDYYFQQLQCIKKECYANCDGICDESGCESGQTFVPPSGDQACYCESPPLVCSDGFYKYTDELNNEECRECPLQCPNCTSIEDEECKIQVQQSDDGFPYPLYIIIGILILYSVAIIGTIFLKKYRDSKNKPSKSNLQQIAPSKEYGNPGYQQVVNTQQGGSQQSHEISQNQLPLNNTNGLNGTKQSFYPKSQIPRTSLNQTQNGQFRNTATNNQFRTTIQRNNNELKGIRQANSPVAQQYGVINEEQNYYPAQQPNINVTPATQIARTQYKKPLPNSKLAPINQQHQRMAATQGNFSTQINPLQRQQMDQRQMMQTQFNQYGQGGPAGFNQQDDQYYNDIGYQQQQQFQQTQITRPMQQQTRPMQQQQQQTRNFNTTIQRPTQPQQQQQNTRMQQQQQTNMRGTQNPNQAWVSPQVVQQQQHQMQQIQQIQQQQQPMRSAVVNHNRNNNFMMGSENELGSNDFLTQQQNQQQQNQQQQYYQQPQPQPHQNYQQRQTLVIEEQYEQPEYAEYEGQQQQDEYYEQGDVETNQQLRQLQEQQQKYGSDLPNEQYYEQQNNSNNQNNNTNNYLQGSPQYDHVMTQNEPEGQPLSNRLQHSHQGSDVDVNEL